MGHSPSIQALCLVEQPRDQHTFHGAITLLTLNRASKSIVRDQDCAGKRRQKLSTIDQEGFGDWNNRSMPWLCAIVTRFVLVYLPHFYQRRLEPVLQTIAVILIVMWLLGMVTSYTVGGFIHILLVLAVVSVLIRIIQGRRLV